MSTSEWAVRLGMVHAVAWLFAIAGQVALLVVIATAVRRHRPDAFRPLLAWSIACLAYTVLRSVVSALVNVLAARGGMDAMFLAQLAETCISVVVGGVLVALLALGLVRLAQPPRPVVVDGAPPYR